MRISKGERSPTRLAQRNGHRPELLSTPAGDVEVRIPKLRKGSSFPELLEVPDLPALDGQANIARSRQLTTATRELQRDLTSLLRWVEKHAVALGELQAADASLGQVFHEIWGAQPPEHATDDAAKDHR